MPRKTELRGPPNGRHTERASMRPRPDAAENASKVVFSAEITPLQ